MKPHFKYYMDGDFVDRPEPMFGMWMENAKGFSDVCGETLLAAGLPLPLFPDYKTWRREVLAAKRCGRCWAVVDGHDGVVAHSRSAHLSAPIHMPAKVATAGIAEIIRKAIPVLLLAFMFTGCERIRHITGLDRHDATPVSVPVATSIIRQLPASSGITFTPDRIDGAPSVVRVFVKNGDWLTATPGGWYEIPWAVDVDTRTTEYAVISFAGQGARVYNQPGSSPRAVIVESVPKGAFDPGIPPQ